MKRALVFENIPIQQSVGVTRHPSELPTSAVQCHHPAAWLRHLGCALCDILGFRVFRMSLTAPYSVAPTTQIQDEMAHVL